MLCAQASQIKPRAVQLATWEATAVVQRPCPCLSLRHQVGVIGPGNFLAVGPLAAISSLVLVTTAPVVKADVADGAREEIWILPIPRLRSLHLLAPILSVLTYPSISPCIKLISQAMEFEHPNLGCESFHSKTSGMDSLLVMYQRLPLHQGNFPHGIPKGWCHRVWIPSSKSASWGNLRLSLCLFFSLTLHQPELPVPRPRLQQTPLGTLQSEKDPEAKFLLRLRDFFLIFTTCKNILLKVEKGKIDMKNVNMWTRKSLIFILSIWEMSQ